MIRQVRKTTEKTTTTTDYIELVPGIPGEEQEPHYLTVHESGRMNQRSSGYSYYPSIMLSGRWLGRAGFDPGSKVQVRVSENRIVVEKLVEGAPKTGC